MLRPRMMLIVIAGLAVLLSTASVAGQPLPGDASINQYLARRAKELDSRFLDGAQNLHEWQSRRPHLHKEYLDMLGLWPLPEKTSLHATVTGTLEREEFIVMKLHFQSRPGLYVTGNLYRPKRVAGKLPAIVYVCGHSGRGRDGNKTAFQDHGMWFGANGYVCLVIDTLQLGEIPGIHHGTYREGRWWWQALGYTPAGVECWNGIRAIDYLVSRPDVDPERIGVTGISGGGAATFWIAAADERVRCAVPVSGMSDLESYVANKVVNGHCDCMFLVNSYGWEWTTIAALIAPRPMLFCNSDQDSIFPMDGNRRIIVRLRKLYAMHGQPQLVDEHVSHGGHDYRPDLRIAIFQWINKHLKNDTSPVRDADFKPIPTKELRVFAEDKDLPPDAVNGRIDESFVKPAHVSLPEPGKYEGWKQALVEAIRRKSFGRFPPQPAAVKFKEQTAQEDPRNRQWIIHTEPEITARLVESPPGSNQGKTRSLFVAETADVHASAEFKRDYTLLVRGVDRPWTRKSPPNYVERAHVLIGHTVDEGRVWDILATIRGLNAEAKEPLEWELVGHGQAGILAAYAALLEPSISHVRIIDPPTSHRQGPIFLNILRVLDIPDALGLLAPRRLTLIGAHDKAFDRTEQLYKLAGASDKLDRK